MAPEVVVGHTRIAVYRLNKAVDARLRHPGSAERARETKSAGMEIAAYTPDNASFFKSLYPTDQLRL